MWPSLYAYAVLKKPLCLCPLLVVSLFKKPSLRLKAKWHPKTYHFAL